MILTLYKHKQPIVNAIAKFKHYGRVMWKFWQQWAMKITAPNIVLQIDGSNIALKSLELIINFLKLWCSVYCTYWYKSLLKTK